MQSFDTPTHLVAKPGQLDIALVVMQERDDRQPRGKHKERHRVVEEEVGPAVEVAAQGERAHRRVPAAAKNKEKRR